MMNLTSKSQWANGITYMLQLDGTEVLEYTVIADRYLVTFVVESTRTSKECV